MIETRNVIVVHTEGKGRIREAAPIGLVDKGFLY